MLNVRQTQGERRVYALLVFCIELLISARSSGFSGKTPMLLGWPKWDGSRLSLGDFWGLLWAQGQGKRVTTAGSLRNRHS